MKGRKLTLISILVACVGAIMLDTSNLIVLGTLFLVGGLISTIAVSVFTILENKF